MNNLRARIKEKRKQLSDESLKLLGNDILKNIHGLISFEDHEKISTYFSVNNEADTSNLNNYLWDINKDLFLPKIKQGRLLFSSYSKDQKFSLNDYGIPEPEHIDEKLIEAEKFDLMFIPLVAFDTECNRIGMGGGYYDKTLAFKKESENKNKPLLIGLAYEFQKIEAIEKNAWDIPMDAIITEDRTYTV
tara:strand:+ start:357 stop:926 length:570 start_codon:yes stop_codon:yes gene_type:complete